MCKKLITNSRAAKKVADKILYEFIKSIGGDITERFDRITINLATHHTLVRFYFKDQFIYSLKLDAANIGDQIELSGFNGKMNVKFIKD